MRKKILLSLLVVFVILQFIRPEKNESDNQTNHISKNYPVPNNVNIILQKACNDCHSNKTEYPWYSNIQPIGWWMADHVNEGKRHLNFSEFTTRRIAWQNHKLEETIEEVKEHKMPLDSYTWMGMHPEANLTDEQRAAITQWAQTQMDTLKVRWPADSLVMKRRTAPATGAQ